MATYSFSGYTADGKARHGRLAASGEKAAARALQEQGVFVEHIRPVPAASGMTSARRAALYREWGALLAAGLPLDRALALMMETPDPAFSAVLDAVLGAVREGACVADALAAACPDVDGYERAALASAERTATLPDMLRRMADWLDAQETVRDRVRSALVYPAFVLVFGIVVAVLMLGVLVPRTTAMLVASGMDLPLTSVRIVAGSKVLAVVLVALLAAAVLAYGVMRRVAARHADAALRLDAMLLRLPLARSAAHLAGMRFASMLSVLAESGMPLVAALPVAGAGTGRPWLAHCVKAAAEQVRNGLALAEAVRGLPVMGAELAEWIRVGEAGGCLPAMLDAAAARLRREWERALARRLALLEPALLAGVGLFVLVLALALILPVVGMTRALGMG